MNKWIKRSPLLAVMVIAVALVVAFVFSEGLRDGMVSLLEWFKDRGAGGVALYTAFYTVMVVLTVPAVIFTFGSGFVFGFWVGSLAITVSIAVGSSTAFMIARYFFSERVSKKLMRHKKLKALDRGLQKEGWKIVLLSRLVPGFPFKLSNYFFGLTSVSFKGFFIGNMLGIMPILILNVYVGSVAADLDELLKGDRGPVQWISYGIGFIALLALIYYLRRWAKASLDEAISNGEEKPVSEPQHRAH